MPRKLELTFFKSKKQWKKKKYGKVHYLGHGESRWDMASYDLALDAWNTLEPKLDEEHRAAVDPRTPEEKEADAWWQARPQRHLSEAGRWVMHDRQMREDQQKVDRSAPTIDKMLDRFLERKRQQAESDQRSPGRFINLRMYAEQFADFVGRDKPVTVIDSMALMDYHSKALADMAAEKITGWCGRDRMQVARQFIVFIWEMGLIELPRNIRSRELDINCSAGKIEVFDVKRLREIMDLAPEKLKLWLLLMANCGMTQKDVSDLRQDQIDWENGAITRKRSKTKDSKTVPTVTYTLWPKTLEMLRSYRGGSGRVFTNSAGGALAGSKLTASGGKFDLVLRTYNAFLREKKIKDGKTLKAIRKTSASKIGEHREFGKFSQYFLGQAPRTVADRHYVQPTEAQFKRCLHWLGQQYGFVASNRKQKKAG
jgi:integrase